MKTARMASSAILLAGLSLATLARGDDGYARADAEAFAAKVLAAVDIVGDEYIEKVPPGKLVDQAIRGLFDGLPQKLPKDIEDRLKNVEKEANLKKLIADARFHLGKNKALDEHRDLSLAVNAMLSRLDPYCSFDTNPRPFGHPDWPQAGVGIKLGLAVADGVEVLTPLAGGPAQRADIRAADVIAAVTRLTNDAGTPLDKPETVSLKGKTGEQAAKLLMGKPGSSVRLTIQRKGTEKPLPFDLVRAVVKPETVLGFRRGSDTKWDYWLNADKKIGYVRIDAFGQTTAQELTAVVRDLEKQEAKGLVLDLRFCPGGLLSASVEVADLFIDDQVIVTIKPRVGAAQSYSGKREGTCKDLPVVCLVNEETASGAEIVAACLQDHRRGVIVGAKTFGKASLQNIQPFEMGLMKLTVATFLRPTGHSINRAGVMPQKADVVELKDEERGKLLAHLRGQEIIPAAKEDKFTDRQLERALVVLKDAKKP